MYEARQWSAALGRARCAIAAECRAMSINVEPVVTATVFYRINDILLLNLKLFRLLWRAGIIVVTIFVAFSGSLYNFYLYFVKVLGHWWIIRCYTDTIVTST